MILGFPFSFLPVYILQEIKRIPLLQIHCRKIYTWDFSEDGNFSLKLAYGNFKSIGDNILNICKIITNIITNFEKIMACLVWLIK